MRKLKFSEWMFTGVLFSVGFPIFIYLLYKYSWKAESPIWNAADVLSYYGTLLGAVATIIAVVLTIKYSSETSIEDRKHSKELDKINSSTQVCFDLIESCQFVKIMEILEILPDKSGWEVLSMTDRNIEKKSRELFVLSNQIRTNKKKLEFYYKDELSEDYIELTEYFDEYTNLLEFIANCFNPENEESEENNFNLGHDYLEELQILYNGNNDTMIQRLNEMVHYSIEKETAK